MRDNGFVILVTGVLCDAQERILLLKRSKTNKSFQEYWQLPEGKMEFGEQPRETLARELDEELGLKLKDAESFDVCSKTFSVAGKRLHLLRIIMLTHYKGKILLSKEHSEYKWVNLAQARKMPKLVPGIKEVLTLLNL
ncbi:MAG: 7,8-dihydro-8-oxoguanine triphosphatase [Microgenomates group bacterium Gr01-1014_5]|nr:MAG: 7,8-dihydro-8-oxoguanine triphosphatase [Microgenomates group bacterium Gr01-1014_5]